MLLASDDYEAMRETIAVLSDSELMTSIRLGLAELKAGDYLTEDQLAEHLRRAGRAP